MAFDFIIVVFALAIAIILSFCYIIWIMALKPKLGMPGIFSNPKSKRRKIPILRGPDYMGYILDIIQEAGTGVNEEIYTFVLGVNNGTLLIPHVNLNRHIACFNMAQTLADAESPIYDCSVDRTGIEHPGKLESLQQLSDTFLVRSLKEENKNLRIEVAKMKEELKLSSSPEVAIDQMSNLAESINRMKKALSDPSNEEQKLQGNQGIM